MTQKNAPPQHDHPDESHSSGHFRRKQRYPVHLRYQNSHRQWQSHHIQIPDNFHRPWELQKQAAGLFQELLHLLSHHFPVGAPLPYFPVIQDTLFHLLPSYSFRQLTEKRILKSRHLPVLSLYNHEFRLHWRCSADSLPTYEDRSDSCLSVPAAYYQTDEKSLSDETHFPHIPFSTQIQNIGKPSIRFQAK